MNEGARRRDQTLMDCALFSSALRVLICIAQEPEARQDQISEQARISIRQVRRALNQLQDDGLITSQRIWNHSRHDVCWGAALAVGSRATVADLLTALRVL